MSVGSSTTSRPPPGVTPSCRAMIAAAPAQATTNARASAPAADPLVAHLTLAPNDDALEGKLGRREASRARSRRSVNSLMGHHPSSFGARRAPWTRASAPSRVERRASGRLLGEPRRSIRTTAARCRWLSEASARRAASIDSSPVRRRRRARQAGRSLERDARAAALGARNGVHRRPVEVRRRVFDRCAVPCREHADEHVLRELLGFVPVAGHEAERRVQPGLLRFEERLERARVAALGAGGSRRGRGSGARRRGSVIVGMDALGRRGAYASPRLCAGSRPVARLGA